MSDNQNYNSEKFPFVINFLFLFFQFANIISICIIVITIVFISTSNLPPIFTYAGILFTAFLIIGLCFQIAIQELFKVLFAIEKNTSDTSLVLKMLMEKLQENNPNDNPPPLPKS